MGCLPRYVNRSYFRTNRADMVRWRRGSAVDEGSCPLSRLRDYVLIISEAMLAYSWLPKELSRPYIRAGHHYNQTGLPRALHRLA